MSLVAQPPTTRESISSIPATGAAAAAPAAAHPQRGQQLAHIESLPDATKKRPLEDNHNHCSSRSSSSSSSSANDDDDDDSTDSSDDEEESEDEMISPEPCVGGAAICEAAPALPAKSSLRASRVMVLPHKMAAAVDQPPPFSQTAPHDVYLSSEEDASSSADDFSDFDLDSDNEQSNSKSSASSPKRRGSHEDTARVVSVIFAGKPNIVNLPPRSTSPSSVESTPQGFRRLQRTCTEPSFARRLSISSSVSSSILHPPRTSSMLPGRRLEKQRPDFLKIDPFASAKPDAVDRHETESPRPKTPTAMFKRTLSLVRKRSKPQLAQGMYSRESLSIQTQFNMAQVAEEPKSEDSPVSARNSNLSYNDILKNAKRRTQTPISPMSDPATPLTPGTPGSTRSRLRNGFSAAARRRSSIRG